MPRRNGRLFLLPSPSPLSLFLLFRSRDHERARRMKTTYRRLLATFFTLFFLFPSFSFSPFGERHITARLQMELKGKVRIEFLSWPLLSLFLFVPCLSRLDLPADDRQGRQRLPRLSLSPLFFPLLPPPDGTGLKLVDKTGEKNPPPER